MTAANIDLEATKLKLEQGLSLADIPGLVDELITEIEALRERVAELAERLDRQSLNHFQKLEAAEAMNKELADTLEDMTDRFEAALEATHATRTDRQYIKEARATFKKAQPSAS